MVGHIEDYFGICVIVRFTVELTLKLDVNCERHADQTQFGIVFKGEMNNKYKITSKSY